MAWDLEAFLRQVKDLTDSERESCFNVLKEEGYGTKQKAFFALTDDDFKGYGIGPGAVRKSILIAFGQGAAAGLGGGSMVAGGGAAGPGPSSTAAVGSPATKLRLRQDTQNTALFFFEPLDDASNAAPAGLLSSSFFLDPKGSLTAELQDWLGRVVTRYLEGKPIPPLFLNGLTKTGKSFLLNMVLPAMARTHFRDDSSSGGGVSGSSSSDTSSGGGDSSSGGGDSSSSSRSGMQRASKVLPEPNFLPVDCLACTRNGGVAAFLEDFLFKLKESAARQQLFDAANSPVPSNRSVCAMIAAIFDLMWCLPRDRLNFLLLDETQSFYLLQHPGSADLDTSVVLHMRFVLKDLLLKSPHWVCWAVTGSSMATLWANVAATPTNGFALISHHYQIDLEAVASTETLQVAWEQLKIQHAKLNPALPDDLIWRSPQHYAMLAYMCDEWSIHGRKAGTAAALVNQTLMQKLIPEALADLRVVLQVLGKPAEQLLLLRELLDPTAGVASLKLPEAFRALLGRYTTECEGKLHLYNPLFAQVLQMVTTESGDLVDSLVVVPSLSSRMFRELATLGECCKHSSFESYQDLQILLKEMADALNLEPDVLLKEEWFVQVLDHRLNSVGGKEAFMKRNEAKARKDPAVGLRWYHSLLRNVLDHGSLTEQQKALDDYPEPLTVFHSSGRISDVLTRTYTEPLPSRKLQKPLRAQLQARAGPMRPMALSFSKPWVRVTLF